MPLEPQDEEQVVEPVLEPDVEVVTGEALEPATSVRRSAERAILVPIGAALTARDQLFALLDSVSTPEKTEARMRQFEERGMAARRRVEDELRRRRAQGKSELGARAGRAGTQIRENATDLAAKLQEIVSSVGADVPTESS